MSGSAGAGAAVEVGTEPGGEISPLLYGQYLEHLDDCIYPALWDGGSPLSDARGLRRDVISAAADLGVPVVRWPGGCFADVYHWQDGVGPRDERPVRRNWHWGGLEPNHFGTDEFLGWCEAVGAEPYVNLNLGTGTLDEALRWMDYCNGTDETDDVLRRRANGRHEPYGVRLWGVGNETWGPWEAGTTGAGEYARTLANWADFARSYQPSARLLAVGSAEGADPDWDRTVLDAAGAHLDYLTCHVYGYTRTEAAGDDYERVAFTPAYIEARLRAMAATLEDFPCIRADGGGPVRIAVDEWNIRHFAPDGAGGHRLDRGDPRTVQDAVFAAGVLNAMVRLSPAVGMANYVFLVNGNGVLNVRGEELVKTPLYHLFRRYRRWMRGHTVETHVSGPDTALPEPQADRPGHTPVTGGLPGRVPYLDAAAALDGDRLTLSLVNRHRTAPLSVRLPDAAGWDESWTLTHENVLAANDADDPERVQPQRQAVDPDIRERSCPPHSVTLLRGRVR